MDESSVVNPAPVVKRNIVAVSGGRTYSEKVVVFRVLDEIHVLTAIDLLANGGATGADELSTSWAAFRGVPWCTFSPAWKAGKQAGPLRTTAMLELLQPAMLVAFPGGNGTAHAIREATRLGIHVWKPEEKCV